VAVGELIVSIDARIGFNAKLPYLIGIEVKYTDCNQTSGSESAGPIGLPLPGMKEKMVLFLMTPKGQPADGRY